jgi:uncharacterized membrane protein
MGENNFAQLPIALYGVVLWMSGLAYYILAHTLISLHGNDSLLATALGRKIKEMISLVCYTAAIIFSFFSAGVSLAIYVFVACMWLVPDKRIERTLTR